MDQGSGLGFIFWIRIRSRKSQGSGLSGSERLDPDPKPCHQHKSDMHTARTYHTNIQRTTNKKKIKLTNIHAKQLTHIIQT